jgi:hypothetical protein
MALFRHWDCAVIHPPPRPDSRRKAGPGLYTEVPSSSFPCLRCLPPEAAVTRLVGLAFSGVRSYARARPILSKKLLLACFDKLDAVPLILKGAWEIKRLPAGVLTLVLGYRASRRDDHQIPRADEAH